MDQLFFFPESRWIAHKTESWPSLLSSQKVKQIFIKRVRFTRHWQEQIGLRTACLIRSLERPFAEYHERSWWYALAAACIDSSLPKVRSMEPRPWGASTSLESLEPSDSIGDDSSLLEDSPPLVSSPLSVNSCLKSTQGSEWEADVQPGNSNSDSEGSYLPSAEPSSRQSAFGS